MFPLQQPFGHDSESQMHLPKFGSPPVASQRCPLTQPVHEAPCVPHVLIPWPFWQWPLTLQQPFGHVFLSQMQ